MSETIDLAQLSPAQLVALVAQIDATRAAERKKASDRRADGRKWLKPHALAAMAKFGFRTSAKGVVGMSVGGTVKATDPDTGKPRDLRITLRYVWADTVPVRAKSDDDDDTDDTADDATDGTDETAPDATPDTAPDATPDAAPDAAA